MDDANPLDEPLRTLFGRLNFLHFLVHFVDKQLNDALANFQEEMDHGGGTGRLPSHGTSLVITDLTGPTDGGWLLHGRTGSYKVEGNEHRGMLETLRAREGALSIAQGYEAFETFLYDITAAFLSRCDRPGIQTVLGRETKGNLKADVRAVFRRKENLELIKALRKLGPSLRRAEDGRMNNRRLSLRDWYVVVGKVRHAATHSAFEIKADQLDMLTHAQLQILKVNFPGDSTDAGLTLKVDKDSSVFAIQLFAEYGHAVYKSLSVARGWEWIRIVGDG